MFIYKHNAGPKYNLDTKYMYEDLIRYDKLIDSAMRFVVKEALKEVCKVGLKGEHHFLLSFLTDSEGVEIPKTLKDRYPNEMTIVIQHQFENLSITEDKLFVTLSFDGRKEKIVVPFVALTSFADPGVKFGLKFNLVDEAIFLDEATDKSVTDVLLDRGKRGDKAIAAKEDGAKKSSAKGKGKSKLKTQIEDGNVVLLDAFRVKE